MRAVLLVLALAACSSAEAQRSPLGRWALARGGGSAACDVLEVVGAKAIALYETDSGLTSVSNAASAWADRTANNNDVAQGDSAKRLDIVAGEDGYDALQSAGTEKYLQLVNGFAGAAIGDYTTFYVVAETTATDAQNCMFVETTNNSASGNGSALYHDGSSGPLVFRADLAGGAVEQAVWAGHAPPDGITLYKGTVSESDERTRLYTNGTLRATSSGAGTGGVEVDTDDIRIGGLFGNEWLHGRIYTVLVLSANLTSGEEAELHDCLDERYPSIGGLP